MNLTQTYREALNEQHSKAFAAWFTLSDADKVSEVGIKAKSMLVEYTALLASLNANELADRKEDEHRINSWHYQD